MNEVVSKWFSTMYRDLNDLSKYVEYLNIRLALYSGKRWLKS